MKYPRLESIQEFPEMTSDFRGLDHTASCKEGFFYDMKNITGQDYPVMSTRDRRSIERTFTDFQGMIDKDGLVYIDDGKLYIDGVEKTGISFTSGMKTIEKMGAFIVVFPDKKWYNTKDGTSGDMDNEFAPSESTSISLEVCTANVDTLEWHDADYYKTHEVKDGDYKMDTINGKTSLSVYNETSGLWVPLATTYVKISASGIDAGFEKGDGINLEIDLDGVSWDYAKNFLVNEDGTKRNNNFSIFALGTDYIVVPAIIDENKTFTAPVKVSRKAPDMSFVVECQNRLWGCAPDGHEVYCCKLGDVKNWKCYAGISTDSWAATIGSDGVFTGAISFLGYPLFFKEDSIIRISISSIGAHSTKETKCRGVEVGSEKSLLQLNEVLFYKSPTSICVYDGSFPTEISKNLGGDRYSQAIAGSIDNRYYVSLKKDNKRTVFVYDSATSIWTKEDDIDVVQYVRRGADLYFVADNNLYKTKGGTEAPFDWFIESGNIGYEYNGKKNLSRINIRMSLPVGSEVHFFVNYDSSNVWTHVFNMSGRGLKTFTIPVRPHRCDHFRFKMVGHGDAKIFGITKSYTQGSDV